MAMKSENFLVSTRKPLPHPKLDTLSVSEMLTPSEIEQLRQDKKELAAWEPEAFAHLNENNPIAPLKKHPSSTA
jgi:hypothetical protein